MGKSAQMCKLDKKIYLNIKIRAEKICGRNKLKQQFRH